MTTLTHDDFDHMEELLSVAVRELESAESRYHFAATHLESLIAVMVHLHPNFLASESREDALEGKHPERPWKDEIKERGKALRSFVYEEKVKST